MVAVSQENSHKSLVKRSIASLNKTSRNVRAWSGTMKQEEETLFYFISFLIYLKTTKSLLYMFVVISLQYLVCLIFIFFLLFLFNPHLLSLTHYQIAQGNVIT